jgi:hypothetical protein
VALAEVGDGPEVRPVQAGHRHNVDPLLAGAGELTRRVQATAVAIEKQGHHHAGMVGRIAALLGVAVDNSRKVEPFAHRVTDEMRQVTGRHELMQRGRQKPALIDIPRAKHFGHEASESPRSHPVQRITRTGS